MLTASEMAELDRRIAVMSAFRNGVKIRGTPRYPAKNWQPTEHPSWDWSNADFEIAPEPRKPKELWITPQVKTLGGFVYHVSEEQPTHGFAALYREVLPD